MLEHVSVTQTQAVGLWGFGFGIFFILSPGKIKADSQKLRGRQCLSSILETEGAGLSHSNTVPSTDSFL